MIDLGFIGESNDYWWDVGVDRSREILSKFSAQEWEELLAAWSAQSEEWQDQLAYILGEDATSREILLLLNMFQSPLAGVSIRAAESLRDLPFDRVRPVALESEIAPIADISNCANVNELLKFVSGRRR